MGCGASADGAAPQTTHSELTENQIYHNVSASVRPSPTIDETALGSGSQRKLQVQQVPPGESPPTASGECPNALGQAPVGPSSVVDHNDGQRADASHNLQLPTKSRSRSENRRVTLPGEPVVATNQSSDHTSSHSKRSNDRSVSAPADLDQEHVWPIGDAALMAQLPRRDDAAASPSSRRVTRGPSMLLVDPIDQRGVLTDATHSARENRLSSIGRPATSVAGEDLSVSRESAENSVPGRDGAPSFLYQASEGAPLRTESGAAFAFGSFEGIGSTPGSIFCIPPNFQHHLLSPPQGNLKRASQSSSATTTTTTTSGTAASLGSAQYRPLLGSGSAFVSQQNLPQFSPHATQSLHNRSNQSPATSLSAAVVVPVNAPAALALRNPPQPSQPFFHFHPLVQKGKYCSTEWTLWLAPLDLLGHHATHPVGRRCLPSSSRGRRLQECRQC